MALHAALTSHQLLSGPPTMRAGQRNREGGVGGGCKGMLWLARHQIRVLDAGNNRRKKTHTKRLSTSEEQIKCSDTVHMNIYM